MEVVGEVVIIVVHGAVHSSLSQIYGSSDVYCERKSSSSRELCWRIYNS